MSNNVLNNKIINTFIQWLILVLIAIDGLCLVIPVLERAIIIFPQAFEFDSWEQTLAAFDLFEIPQFVLGCALILSSIGLAMRTRTAWFFSLVILFCTCAFTVLSAIQSNWVILYSLGLMVILLLRRNYYDRSSVVIGSYFALVSLLLLLFYSVIGSLHMGSQFKPALTDLPTAVYFSLVTMSTVGYGDIVPYTADARFFTLSVIMFGITFFTASISGVTSSIIGGGLKRIFHGRRISKMRKNHYIIAGASPLALSLYQGLKERGITVTVIAAENAVHAYPSDADIVVGDASNTQYLLEAGADKAKFVLALRNDDSDNVFIILAAKEVVAKETKIISLVNSSNNLQKIKRVEPDMLFSLQLLGSELLIRTLNNDAIDNKLVTDLFFGHINQPKPAVVEAEENS